jgi:hypothetical protein
MMIGGDSGLVDHTCSKNVNMTRQFPTCSVTTLKSNDVIGQKSELAASKTMVSRRVGKNSTLRNKNYTQEKPK